MPHVQITWVERRTVEQKRKIAERVTAVLIEDGKAKRENIHVSFHDLPATNYAEAGVLVYNQASASWAYPLFRFSRLFRMSHYRTIDAGRVLSLMSIYQTYFAYFAHLERNARPFVRTPCTTPCKTIQERVAFLADFIASRCTLLYCV